MIYAEGKYPLAEKHLEREAQKLSETPGGLELDDWIRLQTQWPSSEARRIWFRARFLSASQTPRALDEVMFGNLFREEPR